MWALSFRVRVCKGHLYQDMMFIEDPPEFLRYSRQAAFRQNVSDTNTIAWDACIAPLDHFGLFASFALVALDVQGKKRRRACPLTRSLSTSIMADITTVAALYLLYKSQKRRKTTRRRVWVHEVLRRCTELGEFHCLLQEHRLDDNRFQQNLRLTGAHFEDLLAWVGAHSQLQLASPPCWSECKQPYVSDVVGLNSMLIGCRSTTPPEKFDIFNFICVASDTPLQTLQTLQTPPDASFVAC